MFCCSCHDKNTCSFSFDVKFSTDLEKFCNRMILITRFIWLKLTVLFITIVKVVFVFCVRGGGGVIIFHREEFSLPLRPDGFRNLVVH